MKDYAHAMRKVIEAMERAASVIEEKPNVKEYVTEVYGEYDDSIWYVLDSVEESLKCRLGDR
jgi:hypothetical protein